jgi:hypothetical protein
MQGMLPHLGAGSGQELEDVLVLCQLFNPKKMKRSSSFTQSFTSSD